MSGFTRSGRSWTLVFLHHDLKAQIESIGSLAAADQAPSAIATASLYLLTASM